MKPQLVCSPAKLNKKKTVEITIVTTSKSIIRREEGGGEGEGEGEGEGQGMGSK